MSGVKPTLRQVHIGYISRRRVLDQYKLAQVVEIFSRRLQVQERLNKQIAQFISDLLQIQDVGVGMESSHLC